MPPKIHPKPLKHRELLKRLRDFDVTSTNLRGKGSEQMLVLRSGLINGVYVPGQYKGPQYPIKYHGDGTEHSVRVIDSILRHFNIDPHDFW